MEAEDALLRYADEAEAAARIVALCWELCELRSAAGAAAEVPDVYRGVSGGVGGNKRGDAGSAASARGGGDCICRFPALSGGQMAQAQKRESRGWLRAC